MSATVAQRMHKLGVPGYYVVNPSTGLAVDGPFDHDVEAQWRAASLNTTPPIAPDVLEVRLVGSDLEAKR